MKKTIIAGAIAILLISYVLLLLTPQRTASKLEIGRRLPAGKVTPQLASTWDTAVLLAPDGSLWGWGGTEFKLDGLFARPTVTQIPKRMGTNCDWAKVAVSWTHILALKKDGSLWGWGLNGSGQLAQSNATNRYSSPAQIGHDVWNQICVGASHCLALRKDGSLWAWGQNDHGQVGDGTRSNKFTPTLISPERDWKSIEAGHFNSFALKGDGTVWGWGLDPISRGSNDSLTPQQIDPDANWVAISASDFYLLALKSDGTLWVRGQNAQVAYKDYVTTSTATFTQIGGDKDWATVYAGQSYFFARKRDGSWWVCGNNNYGQLGIGSTGSVHSPQRLPFQFEPWAFSPGLGTAVLLGQDGTLWTWGKRLGTAPHNRRVRTFINRILDVLPSQLGLKTGNLIIDPKPYPLWQFPADIRRSLIDDAGKE